MQEVKAMDIRKDKRGFSLIELIITMAIMAVFAGAIITKLLGESTDAGNLGQDFAMMAGLVFVALMVEVIFLRPKTVNMTDK